METFILTNDKPAKKPAVKKPAPKKTTKKPAVKKPARARKPAPVTGPTHEQFSAYARAYDYFNAKLFGGELPRCLLNFSRLSKSMGFFAPKRWAREGIEVHEISLNPDVLALPFVETMQTLVHEMCHLWQCDFGQPSRAGYHNQEWAVKMVGIGLMPSDTGKPGGKATGQAMSDYPIPGGPFLAAFNAMPDATKLPWKSFNPAAMAPAEADGEEDGEEEPKEPKAKNKVKYACCSCDLAVWGKPGLDARISCIDCGEMLTEVPPKN
jgi:hypothetical protein